MEATNRQQAPTGQGVVILGIAMARCRSWARQAHISGAIVYERGLLEVERALEARAEMGKEKYGTYLRANNGRDAAVDLYQEVLDAIMYAEQCKYEAEQYDKALNVPVRLLVGARQLERLYKMAAELSAAIV